MVCSGSGSVNRRHSTIIHSQKFSPAARKVVGGLQQLRMTVEQSSTFLVSRRYQPPTGRRTDAALADRMYAISPPDISLLAATIQTQEHPESADLCRSESAHGPESEVRIRSGLYLQFNVDFLVQCYVYDEIFMKVRGQFLQRCEPKSEKCLISQC